MNFYKLFFIPFLIIVLLVSPLSGFCAAEDKPYSVPSLPQKAPDIRANAVLLVNNTKNAVLYEKNSGEKIYPASTTKIITASIIISAVESGRYSLDTSFAADGGIYYNTDYDSATEHIQPGEIMTVRDYLYCTLLSSANEACNALAVFNSGSVENFVSEMNSLASSLGCTGTHFTNTNGLPDADHYTTAYDLYLIFRHALKSELFSEISSSVEYTVPETNLTPARRLVNSNMLINPSTEYYYRFAVLGKTGTTDLAGSCLVSLAEKNGNELICILMGAKTVRYSSGYKYIESFPESLRLFEYGFSSFGTVQLLEEGTVLGFSPVKYGKDADSVSLTAGGGVSLYMEKAASSLAEYKIIPYDNLKNGLAAPLAPGTAVGKVEVYCGGKLAGETALVTADGVQLSYIGYISDIFGVSQRQFITISAAVLTAIFIITAAAVLIARRRSRVNAAHAEEDENLRKYENSRARFRENEPAGK